MTACGGAERSVATAPSARAAAVFRATAPPGDRVHAIQGRLKYDPARLRYLGQAGGTDLLIVNQAVPGRLELIVLSLDAPAPATHTLVFEQSVPLQTDGIEFEIEAAVPAPAAGAPPRLDPVLVDARPIPPVADLPPVARIGTPVPAVSSAAPGEAIYGDVNLDGRLTVVDVVILARAAVGLTALTVIEGQDQFLIGNVRPVNAGPAATGAPPGCTATATCRPGVDPGNPQAPLGAITVADVAMVARVAVGLPDPVAGHPMLASPGTAPACTSYPHTRRVAVTTPAQLRTALASARPGDLFELRDGRYPGSWVLGTSGTPTAPIVLCGGRNAVLEAGSLSRDVVTLRASHWIIAGLSLTTGLRGIYAERASHNLLEHLTIWNLGQEAVHWRVFSSHNVLRRSAIHTTGRGIAEYGEGVYIGSYRGQWCQFTSCQPDRSDSNAVLENVIGPEVTAELVDVKEGSTGGIIQRNTFDGRGMVRSQQWIDSWVEINGNGYTVSDNQGSTSPRDGFQVMVPLPGWANDNLFSRNVAQVEAGGFGFRLDTKASGNRVTCDNQVHGAGAGYANVTCR